MDKRMRKVCASCGKEELDAEFVGAFCPECAPQASPANLPKRITIERCRHCGKVRQGNGFVESSDETLALVAEAKIRGGTPVLACALTLHKGGSIVPATLDCVLKADGKEMRKVFRFEYEFVPVLCLSCQRIASGYHEAILQLRGNTERVEKAAERFRLALGEGMVTKEKREGVGVDLFIAERDAMMKLVMELHRPYTATRKLKGVKKGKHHFITTVCVRFGE